MNEPIRVRRFALTLVAIKLEFAPAFAGTFALATTIAFATTFALALAMLSSPLAACADDAPAPRYERDVRPIFEKYCQHCHGPTEPKGELNLSDAAGVRKGGESGVVFVAKQPNDSPLLKLVESGEMPPKPEKRPSAAEIATIRRWIETGAAFDTPVAKSLDQHDVLPILLLRCAACHGRQKQEAGLDIRSRAALVKGGKSGPGLVPGKPDDSLIIKRIHAGEMPPKKQLAAFSVKPVEALELAKLRDWIAAGAPELDVAPDMPDGRPDPLVTDDDRKFWAFQPPPFVQPPAPPLHGPLLTPIDAFVARKLSDRGLALSRSAERSTLVRRLHFDLLGLPPSPELVDEVQADDSPDAIERLTDRLLASPRHGERWAQFWLDIAGYSDSEGVQDSDLVRPFAYRYRDYVIRALNADKPYDRFLHEQLAGDELADYEHAPTITPELADNLVATGFLRMTADGTFSGITGFVPDRLDLIDDQLRIVGGGILGLTIGCARCHSHKFDPLPQRDYYRLAAVFKGALDEHDWLKPTRQGGPPGSSDRYLSFVPSDERRAWEQRSAAIDSQLAALRDELKSVEQDAEKKKAVEAKIKRVEGQRPAEPLIRALWDRGEPSPTYLLHRGNYLTPGRLVGPGVPSVLSDGRTPLAAAPPWPGAKKTGLRLAFARWLTQPDHPLTARVHVNRIWKLHFGEGLVRTLDNFGRTGDAPSHPELLDWLARELPRREWSVKSLHRAIVTSATYRQSSQVSEVALKQDPDDRQLSRFPLRRLDAEALNDTLLALAGRLSPRPFGPPDPIVARPDGLVVPAALGPSGERRRAIFVQHRRSQPPTLLADFDRPAMSPNCLTRAESTVAPQALHLLNGALVQELGLAMADRVLYETAESPAADSRVRRAFQLSFGRSPSAEELTSVGATLTQMQERWMKEFAATPPPGGAANAEQEAARRALGKLCHALMNSGELVFVE